MIAYTLISIVIGIGLLFITHGFFLIALPQYVSSVFVGIIIRSVYIFREGLQNPI
jgi:Na+/glutamate symporter